MADDYHLNIILLGDSGVGKTNLLLKYINNDFKDSHIATIGIDYQIKKVKIKKIKLVLHLIDTSGKDKMQSISPIHNQDIDGIVLVFDVTNKQSFENLNGYLTELEKYKYHYQYVIVGNKIDLKNIIQVNKEDIKENDKFNEMKYFPVSAKENTNVEEPFKYLSKLILKKLKCDKSIDYQDNITADSFYLNKSYITKHTKKDISNCC